MQPEATFGDNNHGVEIGTFVDQSGRDYEAKAFSALQSFEPHAQNPRRYRVSQAHQESFQWIWDTEHPKLKFVSWLRSEEPIFWISGKPGAGKSTLMRYLIESKQTMNLLSRSSDASIIVHYFFHELGKMQEKTFGGFLHAIVYQLLVGFREKNQAALSQLSGLLKPHLRLAMNSKPALPEEVLMTILQKRVAECKETLGLYLFVDGFDECHGDHRGQLDFLTDWVRSSSDKNLSVKACIASRVEPEIELRLSNEPTFAIHQHTAKDISAYVTQKLGQAWDLMARQRHGTIANYDQTLIDSVVETAEGVFIWVTIVVSQLVVAIEEEAELHDLYTLLADLPEGLEKLYASIIEKIEPRFWHHTINFLRIFRLMNRMEFTDSMNLRELSAAIQDPTSAISCKAYFDKGFSIDDAGFSHRQCAQVRRRLQLSCRGLIEIEDTENLPGAEVYLVHLTVEDYVTRSQLFEKMLDKVDESRLRDPAVALMAMHLRFLKTCSPPGDYIYDFFWRAMKAAESSTGSSQHLYVEELHRVLSFSNPDWINSYYAKYNGKSTRDWNTDLLTLAAYYNLVLYVEEEIRRHGKGILQRNYNRPLLFYACDGERGNRGFLFAIHKLLLNNGADPMETYGLDTAWSFMVMVRDRYSGYVPSSNSIGLMLEHGADPTQRIFRNEDHSWWNEWPKKLHSTTFHVILSSLGPWAKWRKPLLKSFVNHCKDFEATDSDGVGIQEWADSVDPEMGAFLRQEIAARQGRG